MIMETRSIDHGSRRIVECPEIRTTKYSKDFACGVYWTIQKGNVSRVTTRYPASGYFNEFICNGGRHDFDIAEASMADNTIFNYVQDIVDDIISREAFWALSKFKKPTHQMRFHPAAALDVLTFKGYEIHEN